MRRVGADSLGSSAPPGPPQGRVRRRLRRGRLRRGLVRRGQVRLVRLRRGRDRQGRVRRGRLRRARWHAGCGKDPATAPHARPSARLCAAAPGVRFPFQPEGRVQHRCHWRRCRRATTAAGRLCRKRACMRKKERRLCSVVAACSSGGCSRGRQRRARARGGAVRARGGAVQRCCVSPQATDVRGFSGASALEVGALQLVCQGRAVQLPHDRRRAADEVGHHGNRDCDEELGEGWPGDLRGRHLKMLSGRSACLPSSPAPEGRGGR